MAKGKVRAHVYLTGQVQGVGFRVYTKIKAEEMGIAGWVRNTEDDKVEAVFEGEQAKVKEMIVWCRQGPPVARVSKVIVVWEEWQGLRGFGISAKG